MKKLKLQSLLFSAALLAFAYAGCNENTGDPVTTTAPAAPTNLMANSADYQTVRLKWTASTSAKDANFQDYQLTVTTPSGTSPFAPVIISKDSTGALVSGLTEGIPYTFSLKARNSASTNNASTAATVKWSPADRYTNVKIYETASNEFGSGLSFKNYQTPLKVNAGAQWDIGLDTRDNSFDIGSPSQLSYNYTDAGGTAVTPRTTLLSAKVYEGVSSLDELFDTQVLGDAALNMKPDTARRITFTSMTQNFVFFAKTEDGNYAKVLVKSANGKILQGEAPNRYVLMDISYQAAPNVPYAFVSNKTTTQPAFKTSASSASRKVVKE